MKQSNENSDYIKKITAHLLKMQDEQYRDFHASLMPTVDKSTVIGVRVPALRAYAETVYKDGGYDEFLNDLPHEYYEQNNLHAMLICQNPDFDQTVSQLARFLPYIDNWATCDMINPKAFSKQPEKLLPYIDRWLESDETYTVRFAIGALMRWFADDLFDESYLKKVAAVSSEEYYVKMMVAWYFATLLAKQYKATVPYIENAVLKPWTHNKAIQKAVESLRLTAEQKSYLKTFRIKARRSKAQ